ncbi:MAG: c-type cytochrome [Gemmobacter sp.]
MKHSPAIAAILSVLASPGLAGDPEKGATAFNQCQTCHVVIDADGNTIAGRNARTGPNLYAVIGRQAGTVEGFRYGASLVQAGEKGLVWDEEQLAEYLQDPQGFLRAYLGDNRARSQMSHRVRNADQASDIAAFLASVSPQGDDEEDEEEATD